MGLRARGRHLPGLRLHVDAIQQIVERAFLDDDTWRVALHLRQTERAPVELL